MRTILILWLFIMSASLCAQEVKNLTHGDTIVMHPFDLSDKVFEGLSQDNIPSGKLLDRCLGEEQFAVKYDGKNTQDTVDLFQWLGLSTELYWASARKDTRLDPEMLITKLKKHMREETNNAVYVGLIDMDYQYLDTNAYKQGKLFAKGLTLNDYGQGSKDAYYTGRAFAMAPLISMNYYDELTLVFSDAYFISDRHAEIVNIEMNQNGRWERVALGDERTISMGSGDRMIGFRVTYEDGTVMKTQSIIRTGQLKSHHFEPEKRSTGTVVFDAGGTFSIPGNKLRFRVKYGCGDGVRNNKPVILSPGFQPAFDFLGFPVPITNKTPEELWDQMNFDCFLEDLVNNGHDVYITRYDDPAQSLESNGQLLMKLINYVNSFKTSGDIYENVLIGLSAGGQAGRYALTRMEYEHLNLGLAHHHTRMYMPFDSPHEGVTVPLGSQLSARSYGTVPGDIGSFILGFATYNDMLSGSAVDMFRYHAKNFNMSVYNVENEVANWAPERQNYLNELTSYNPSSSSPGYPDHPRKVAVALGKYNESAATFDAGDLMSHKSGLQVKWFGTVFKLANIRAAENSGSGAQLFNRVRVNSFIWLPGVPILTCLHQYRAKDMYEIEDCNASTVASIHYASVGASQLDGPAIGPTFIKLSPIPFLPVLSGIGVKPTNSVLPWNTEVSYNLQTVGMQYDDNGSGTAIPSPNTGYPRLNFPTNHEQITPFEAFYCDIYTNKHIRVDNDQVALAHFMREEIMPDIRWFQNQNVGEYSAPGTTYKACYEVYNTILAGQEVTYKTDLEPYIVQSNADIKHRAGMVVDLQPGFEAEFGSDYLAEIGPMSCYSTKKEPFEVSFIPPFENEVIFEERQELNSKTTGDFEAYPSPGNGLLTLDFGESDFETLKVFDVSGQLLLQNRLSGNRQILDLTHLEAGIYTIKVENKSQTLTKKIIIE